MAMPSLELVDYKDETGPEAPPWLVVMPPRLRPETVLSPIEVGAHLALRAPLHLLFPTGRPLAESRPTTLVVLDGTWRQARAMYQRVPGLAAIPAVGLSGDRGTLRRLRTSTRTGDRSTLEAIAEAIALAEGEDVAAPLFALHERFVERTLAARGKLVGEPSS